MPIDHEHEAAKAKVEYLDRVVRNAILSNTTPNPGLISLSDLRRAVKVLKSKAKESPMETCEFCGKSFKVFSLLAIQTNDSIKITCGGKGCWPK